VKFSISPTLFGRRSLDPYADIEQRLSTLEAYMAMRGIQSLEETVAGPITIPDGAGYTNILTIPSTDLNIPRDDSFVVITYQMDIAASGTGSSIRGLEGRLNGSQWGGITFTPSGTANFASTTLYARPDYSDLTTSSFAPFSAALSYRIPLVYVPGATGPYGLTLDVRRDLTGWGGTVTVRNLVFSVDVL